MKYGVEMYVRFSVDQKEFRFFAPINFDQIVSERGISAALTTSNLHTFQMADIVINLGNETVVKNRYPDFGLTDEMLSRIKSIPLSDYDVVTKQAQRQFNAEIIGEFKGAYGFLSNFYPATFVYEGIYWHNSESAYQAMKSLDRGVHLMFAELTSPATAKREGRRINPVRSDWEDVKVGIMRDIVFEKFRQSPELKQRLLGTGNAVLEEGNLHGDRVWGISPPHSGMGDNHLGEILMTVRRELRTLSF